MANELIINYPSSSTLYALLFDATGQVWNGSAFAAPSSASWTDYDIAMSEVATATGVYRGSMPAAAAGVYSFVVRKQAGGAPAVADIAVAVGQIEWDGAAEVSLTSRTKPADTQAAVTLVATTTNLTNAPTVGDLTAAMKLSVNAEADAALTDANLDHLVGTATGIPTLPAGTFLDGPIKASLTHIMGEAITGTATLVAAAFSKFFNKATPTGTVNSLPDAVAGATGGVAIVGSAMAVPTDQAVNMTKIAGVIVNTALAQLGVNVVSQENIDFGALQKLSLNAATPASIPGAVGSVTALGAQAKLDVNAEIDTALNTAIPGSPTTDSINERIVALDSHITADYGTTEKAAIDLLDDAGKLPTAADVKTALEAEGSKLDHVWDTTEADGALRRFTENALEQAPSGVLRGAGSEDVPITITVNGLPEAGVAVWVTTEESGANVVAGTVFTDSLGYVLLHLNPGPYWRWLTKAGHNFTNPVAFTVTNE